MLDLHFKAGIRFSLRDKRIFEINEVEITRVDCILLFYVNVALAEYLLFLLYIFYIYFSFIFNGTTSYAGMPTFLCNATIIT